MLSRNRANVWPSAAQLGTSNESVLLPATTATLLAICSSGPPQEPSRIEVDPGVELGAAPGRSAR